MKKSWREKLKTYVKPYTEKKISCSSKNLCCS